MNSVKSPRLRGLLDYWERKRGGRPMPARADIDPVEIPELLAHLILIDVEDGPSHRVRLVGTEIASRYGADFTGKCLEDIDFGELRQTVLDAYLACSRSAAPYVSESFFTSASGVYTSMERLILPLSQNGETAEKLLACIAFEDRRLPVNP